MRYVILRDDDTNALTPVEYLERLYRPFLERGLPVSLAVIPNVRTDITYGRNVPEGFLVTREPEAEPLVPITHHRELLEYLRANPGYHVAQHGYNHEFVSGRCEFEQHATGDLSRRLEDGSRLLNQAGLGQPVAFVAPYDRFTATSFREVARRFPVISTAWFELGRLPRRWWPRYFWKKAARVSHFSVGRTILLSHPPCYLSFRRPYATMLDEITRSITSRRLTVLVAHWWEFFRERRPDEAFIQVLHRLADLLGGMSELQVVHFGDVAQRKIPLN